MSQSASRLWGSRPAVGSSMNSTAGRCRIERATISRWAIRRRARRPRPSPTWRAGSVPRARPRSGASLGGHAEEAPVEVEVLQTLSWRPACSAGRHADQLLGQGGVRYHVDVADEGVPRRRDTRVVSMPAVVVLPAPFGRGARRSPRYRRRGRGGRRRRSPCGIDLGQLDGADDAISRAVGTTFEGEVLVAMACSSL